MGTQAVVAILVPLFLLVVLLVVEIIKARREACNVQDSESKDRAKMPMANVLSFGVKNWRTVQNMVKWKGEVSHIDGLLADLQPSTSVPSAPSVPCASTSEEEGMSTSPP